MSAHDWAGFAEDLERAAQLVGLERSRFLDEVCAGDPRRRTRLERLLVADARASAFLSAPALRPVSARSDLASTFSPSAGDVVARYTISRCIGRGGIGAVYEATQENPRRTVALKLLDPGLAIGTGMLRFRFEALVLGQLTHPGIAMVHEAGEDEHGRGYLAMELVKDASFVTDYVVRANLGTAQLLSLFLDICAAVAYAHQRGVIHRDLKPSNILVDGAGCVKVIDFGIARGLDAHAAALTRDGDVLGTLAYMSPEQLRGRPGDVDVRSDVFALGALLYEMLSGRRLREFKDLALAEVLRRIREDAAAPLSTARPDLPRELGWITSRALELDPARRYASVDELAEDVVRFGQLRPLRAGPPTATYRIAKFARRHRLGVASATALGLVLLGGLVAVVVAERRARELADRRIAAESLALERVEAFQRESAANRAILALQTGWLSTELLDRKGSDVRVVDVLDAAARDLDERCFTSNAIEAEVRFALARAFEDSNLWSRAHEQLGRVRELISSDSEFEPRKRERIEAAWNRAASEVARLEAARPIDR